MKNIITWAMFLSLVPLFIISCGGGDSTASSTSPTSAPTSTPKAAIENTPTAENPVSGVEISLEVGSVNGDELLFDKDFLSAPAGSNVTLTFTNGSDTQQHNWALVENGTKDAVATAGIGYSYSDWVPTDDNRVFANAKLINPGESDIVNFTAPSSGTYQFVCTFPGHNMTMHGTFEVTK